jgi:hypothetical protein
MKKILIGKPNLGRNVRRNIGMTMLCLRKQKKVYGYAIV